MAFENPELWAFWRTKLEPFVTMLLKGKHPMRPIQERFSDNYARIMARYGRFATISQSHEVGPLIHAFGTNLSGGKPNIVFFSHSLKIGYEKMVKAAGSKADEAFQNALTVGFLHETDHLAFGFMRKSDDPAHIIDLEQATWAETCEHTLRPMVEGCDTLIIRSDQETYQAWVDCGRDRSSKAWRDAITSRYTPKPVATQPT